MHPEEPRKAYANLQLTGIVSTDELAEHITHHNSVFSKGTIIGILTELGVCMRELILQGYKVILATFAPGITSEGALTKEAFTAQLIKDMDVNYQPGKSFESLRQDAEFEKTTTRKAQAEALKAENEIVTMVVMQKFLPLYFAYSSSSNICSMRSFESRIICCAIIMI